MRRLFVIVLLALTVATVVYLVSAQGSGYLLIAVGEYTVEMPFVVAVILNLFAFVTLYFSIAVLRMLLSTRSGVLGWAQNRRRRRGLNRTTHGLIAFVEGRWDFARKSLSKSAGNSSTPLVNYLFAARASAAMGDEKAVTSFLKQAELSTEGADVAIGLTQAELQINNGQYEQALATLLRAKKKVHHHPVVLGLLATVYQQLNDWDSLMKLLPALRKYSASSRQDVDALEREACCSMLVLGSDSGLNELLTCWKSLPGTMKKDSAVVACYAENLISVNSVADAERELRLQLHRSFDSRLITLYGLTANQQFDKQLAFAEKLLKSNPDSAALRLALGRICSHHGLTDKAATYFEQSNALEESTDAYAGLANLYAAEGDFSKSVEFYARGLAVQVSGTLTIVPVLAAPNLANIGAEKMAVSSMLAGIDNKKTLFTSTDKIQPFKI